MEPLAKLAPNKSTGLRLAANDDTRCPASRILFRHPHALKRLLSSAGCSRMNHGKAPTYPHEREHRNRNEAGNRKNLCSSSIFVHIRLFGMWGHDRWGGNGMRVWKLGAAMFAVVLVADCGSNTPKIAVTVTPSTATVEPNGSTHGDASRTDLASVLLTADRERLHGEIVAADCGGRETVNTLSSSQGEADVVCSCIATSA
jgi:hypothetical protein